MDDNSQSLQKEELLNIFGLRLNNVSLRYLGAIATWTIIAGSLGFLLLVFTGIDVYQVLRVVIVYKAKTADFFIAVAGLIPFTMNLLMNIFLMRLGILLKRALANQSQEQLQQGLIALRNYMRSLGAYLIIGIAVVVLGVVVALAIGFATNR